MNAGSPLSLHSLHILSPMAMPGHPVCQESITLNTLDSDQSVNYLTVIMPTCSRELKKCRKEEEAMVAAMLQKEKEAAERLQQEEESK
jgi:hypothetical protein